MSTYIEQQSDAQFRAWLSGLDPAVVRLDRAAHMSPEELRMAARTRQDAA